MKYFLITLCLSLSAGAFAQGSDEAKKVMCKSLTMKLSFEYDHYYFKSPSMIKIKVPHSDAEKLIFDLFNSRIIPDGQDDAKTITLSAEGNTFLPRRFFKPKQDGSYSFKVVKNVGEDKASGVISFTSEKDGYQIVDHKIECTISEV